MGHLIALFAVKEMCERQQDVPYADELGAAVDVARRKVVAHLELTA